MKKKTSFGIFLPIMALLFVCLSVLSIKFVGFDFAFAVSGNGGGIYISDSGTFILSGGTISENTCTGNGGGVYVGVNSKFNMTGGTISRNTSQGYGGGVFVESGGTFSMTGGTIEANSASVGGAVYIPNQNAMFVYSSGTIRGEIYLGNNGGGQAYITYKASPSSVQTIRLAQIDIGTQVGKLDGISSLGLSNLVVSNMPEDRELGINNGWIVIQQKKVVIKYNVTFDVDDTNAGDVAGLPTYSLSVEDGTAYRVDGDAIEINNSIITAFPKAGYEFDGWQMYVNGRWQDLSDGASGIVSKDTSFRAKFKKKELVVPINYSITINLNYMYYVSGLKNNDDTHGLEVSGTQIHFESDYEPDIEYQGTSIVIGDIGELFLYPIDLLEESGFDYQKDLMADIYNPYGEAKEDIDLQVSLFSDIMLSVLSGYMQRHKHVVIDVFLPSDLDDNTVIGERFYEWLENNSELDSLTDHWSDYDNYGVVRVLTSKEDFSIQEMVAMVLYANFCYGYTTPSFGENYSFEDVYWSSEANMVETFNEFVDNGYIIFDKAADIGSSIFDLQSSWADYDFVFGKELEYFEMHSRYHNGNLSNSHDEIYDRYYELSQAVDSFFEGMDFGEYLNWFKVQNQAEDIYTMSPFEIVDSDCITWNNGRFIVLLDDFAYNMIGYNWLTRFNTLVDLENGFDMINPLYVLDEDTINIFKEFGDFDGELGKIKEELGLSDDPIDGDIRFIILTRDTDLLKAVIEYGSNYFTGTNGELFINVFADIIDPIYTQLSDLGCYDMVNTGWWNEQRNPLYDDEGVEIVSPAEAGAVFNSYNFFLMNLKHLKKANSTYTSSDTYEALYYILEALKRFSAEAKADGKRLEQLAGLRWAAESVGVSAYVRA